MSTQQSPSWVANIVSKYKSGALNQYVLHGNINDFVPVHKKGLSRYSLLRDYLSQELFEKARLVVFYDRSSGIRFRDAEMKRDFLRSLEAYDTLNGTQFARSVPRNPVQAFALLEMHFRKRLLDDRHYSIVFIIEYAETLVPMGNAAHFSAEDRAIQVYLQRWANEGLFKLNDLSIFLLTENIINLNSQYVRNPYTYEVFIPYPDEKSRLAYLQHLLQRHHEKEGDAQPERHFEMPLEVLAKNTAGLNLAHLRILVAEIFENNYIFTFKDLNRKKKEIIETEAGGLLEFVETKYNLDSVAGHREAKKHLRETASAVKNGRQDVVPMGYLVAGPVGTGKTFLITCFASDIGVPMVILKNFRSKWQGETEGNLEKVLNLLEAMTPVAVMIDEADAYLGNRSSDGDSGVSNRVFSMIASFMSNTDHRGRIIWFLVTARPDLMPVDFKRQGRAEEHIALFYPDTLEDKRELFQVMLKKTGLESLGEKEIDDSFFEEMTVNSGAEMEAALTRAKFRAAAAGEPEVSLDHIREAMQDFLPPTYPEEIELMEYSAVLECTSKALLPKRFRSMSREEVVNRVRELQAVIRS